MSANYISIVGPKTYNLVPTRDNFNVQNEEIRLICDTRLGPVTINLPSIASVALGFGLKFYIDDSFDTAAINNINVVAQAGNSINNVTSYVINKNGAKAEVYIASNTEYGVFISSNDVPVNDKNFVFVQAVPSAAWIINHNLGKKCAVTLVNSLLEQTGGQITYVNLNTVIANFNVPMVGEAYCN